MNEQTIDDRLRREYFEILPKIKLVLAQLEAEVKFELIDILTNLNSYERFHVSSRVKECESAVNALRRRQETREFIEEKPENYSLIQLHDLAGVRVHVFPRGLIDKVQKELLVRFSDWISDPVLGFDDKEILADKYYGYTSNNNRIIAEIQIVPMLTGLFWEVEHAAIYKPNPKYKDVAVNLAMREVNNEVLSSLKKFEEIFEKLVEQNNK